MSHAHPHPHPQPPAGMTARAPPQMMAQAQMPPHTAAILDALPFNPIPFVLKDLPPRPNAPPPLPALLCPEHEQLVCDKCNVDFRDINQLSFFMSLLNPSHPPPPPNVPFAKQGEAVLKTREEGNKRFKDGNHREAGALYSRSVGLSMGKPAWEQAKSSQDEITAALMNRSASAAALGEWPAAYADADACIKLSPKNAKGYFRKAKALDGMSRFEEAFHTMQRGVKVEPDNVDYKNYAEELRKKSGITISQPAVEAESTTDVDVKKPIDAATETQAEESAVDNA
ncbi:hypothetical protein FFLO_01341 [Filobasidium floriforme]|uniref:Uncharacterized protein n=1 Tax=Filobasidium floriforme TaxID=5210 RepID=A0A8K0JRH2_9TREE|nr:hypothetical protein FFLO_01341 [Filobasidium floriforme]